MRLDADAVRLVLKETAGLARQPRKDTTLFVVPISLVRIIVEVVRIIVDVAKVLQRSIYHAL
jgi:hypothetical protein